MANNSWIHEQARATRALLKFYRDHGMIPQTVSDCLAALEQGDINTALNRYADTPLGGRMGCLDDWYPSPIEPYEDAEYAYAVMEALVQRWRHLMQLSTDPRR